jgi:integrase
MTRYPGNNIANKGKPWTTKAINAINAEWKGDTISDGGGLVGDIRQNADGKIKISFKYGFKYGDATNRKKVWHYCGIYPDKSLADIRKTRDEAKQSIAKGIDPRVKKITDKIIEREKQQVIIEREQQRKSENLTVQDMFGTWITDGVRRSDGNKYIQQTFKKYILDSIGNIKIKELTEHHLIVIYKEIIKAGKSATALELSKGVKQMLCWAEIRKPWRALLIDGNPALLVEIDKLLPDDFTKIRDRLLSSDELIKLKNIFDGTNESYLNAKNKYDAERPLKREVQLAMWICLSTVCRIGELLMTEWSHVDFEKRIWFIPAANTKGVKKHKTDHKVYLSDFALKQFKELHKLTGDSKWAFPARYKEGHVCLKSASKQVGDRQVMFKKRTKSHQCRVENNTLVLGNREWTPHDLRRTGSTMIQGFYDAAEGEIIANLCLHHNVVSGSGRHYLFEEHKDKMKEAWVMLGNKLEIILNSNNVVSIDKHKLEKSIK